MKYGEIIELGRHKLMCGDATSRDDVMKLVDGVKVDLVLTDPPYGIKVQHSDGTIGGAGAGSFCTGRIMRGRKRVTPKYSLPFAGDNSIENARKNYEIIREMTDRKIIWGGHYFSEFLPAHGGWIFWDKLRPVGLDFGMGELAYNTCERVIRKYEQKSNGAILQGSRALNPIPRLHPTQKPVELHMKILEDFSKPGDVILDCFGGSGTTLIACEMTGRKCLMMEISPEYCDIIAERYHNLMDGKLPLEGSNDQ